MKFSHFYICAGIASQSYIMPDIAKMQRNGARWWGCIAVTMVFGFAWPFLLPAYIRETQLEKR
nr:transmembrane domain containing protein [Marseillevirus futianmevirus]